MVNNLDRASYSGSLQCIPAEPSYYQGLGIRRGVNPRMLSHGRDVWAVCLATPSPVEGATLRIESASGQIRSTGKLRLLNSLTRRPVSGYFNDGSPISAIAIDTGEELHPLGFQYVHQLPEGEVHYISTLFFQTPSGLSADGARVSAAHEGNDYHLTVPGSGCATGNAQGTALPSWPLDVANPIADWESLKHWADRSPAERRSSRVPPIDHCHATPQLIGLDVPSARAILDEHRSVAGTRPRLVAATFECGVNQPDVPTVVNQDTAPNDLLREDVSAHLGWRCPAMPDVAGMTPRQAHRVLDGLSEDVSLLEPAITLDTTVRSGCTHSTSVVSGTNPPIGQNTWRSTVSNGAITLTGTLRCSR